MNSAVNWSYALCKMQKAASRRRRKNTYDTYQGMPMALFQIFSIRQLQFDGDAKAYFGGPAHVFHRSSNKPRGRS